MTKTDRIFSLRVQVQQDLPAPANNGETSFPVLAGPSFFFVLNAGSSSLKAGVFESGNNLRRIASGIVERIGLAEGMLTIRHAGKTIRRKMEFPDHSSASAALFLELEARAGFGRVKAIAHRVVHGSSKGKTCELITKDLLEEARLFGRIFPEHIPAQLAVIQMAKERFPGLEQFACFDTAFHHKLPMVARTLPIPRRFMTEGLRRYGFHGLSYAYLLQELGRVSPEEATLSRIILAHLGNGASLAAVKGGKCLDTSMGFSPASGLPMSTRSGDIDPGLISFLATVESMTPREFSDLVNRQSGLLGISELSADVRDLLALENVDSRAAEALDYFCYQTGKWMGAFTAVLQGLDTVVFSAGIGENSPVMRARICQSLQFMGLALDPVLNEKNASIISSQRSRVKVRVIRTDEELFMAQSLEQMLAGVSSTRKI